MKGRSIRICPAAGNVLNVTKAKTPHQRYQTHSSHFFLSLLWSPFFFFFFLSTFRHQQIKALTYNSHSPETSMSDDILIMNNFV